MTEHPNATTVQAALDAFAGGDLEGYVAYFSTDVLWHVGGANPLSGDYRGRAAVLDYLQRARDRSDDSLRVEPQSVMADDRYCAVFVRVTGKRGDRPLDVRMAECFRFDESGRLTEFWALADDQPAIDRFWA
ncbi:MAG: nuclear transport factor 2 family protein [Actinomycetia bacterium]|nr:nuclear transport factor 2 family protein [Actinomycetes bacterium]